MATRIIPGVSVTVVKEVVSPQLSPSGVLGLVGLVENDSATAARAGSWSRFAQSFGRASAWSMPEARQALENGAFELVVVPVKSSSAAAAAVSAKDASGADAFALSARARGTWANGLAARVSHRKRGGVIVGFDLALTLPYGNGEKVHQNLTLLPGGPRSLETVLAGGSSVAQATVPALTPEAQAGVDATKSSPAVLLRAGTPAALSVRAAGDTALVVTHSTADGLSTLTIQAKTSGRPTLYTRQGIRWSADAAAVAAALDELDAVTVEVGLWPAEGTQSFAGGKDAGLDDYRQALDTLRDHPDVDMVLAAPQDFTNPDTIGRIYSAVIAHCQVMSADSKGRLGFGQVPPQLTPEQAVELASSLVSDRFVLISPHGVVGAVAGLVGGLPYFQSPTFRTVAGVGALSRALTVEAQQTLLRGNTVPIVTERGRGTLVVRGLTTDGDQINVRRVADRAVRGVKMIGDLFIGRLNTADGRAALKARLSEILLQMEKEGAIVPSTDGTDPAFRCNVYSSQQDFAQGVVRVDIAVRPVRAIDYIYATILVQA